MRILVLSDSHGRADAVEALVQRLQPDAVLHLGDHTRDARSLAALPGVEFYGVAGNCDPRGGVLKQLIELGGVRIFMAHGHEYGVKFGLDRIINAACCADCALLLFGHTHVSLYRVEHGLHILNPGALLDGCYATVEIIDGKITCSLEKC